MPCIYDKSFKLKRLSRRTLGLSGVHWVLGSYFGREQVVAIFYRQLNVTQVRLG